MAETTDDRLRLLVERLERLEEEKKGMADDIHDVYSEAKLVGYDAKITCQRARTTMLIQTIPQAATLRVTPSGRVRGPRPPQEGPYYGLKFGSSDKGITSSGGRPTACSCSTEASSSETPENLAKYINALPTIIIQSVLRFLGFTSEASMTSLCFAPACKILITRQESSPKRCSLASQIYPLLTIS